MSSQKRLAQYVGWICLGVALAGFFTVAAAQQKAEMSNMELVGYNDLQGRNAYIPVIQKQGERWIAYVGHHSDTFRGAKTDQHTEDIPPRLNPLTGKNEPNGTSIVDVTDPRHPKYLAHIPGKGTGEGGGAPFVRVCSGNDLPHADKGKFYLLRPFGNTGWEMWDVTDPAKPSQMNVIISGLHNTHNAWWECDSGIAYLAGGPLDWLSHTMGKEQHDALSHAMIYDLSNPAKPVFIRSFGLPGQQTGSASPQLPVGLHGTISTGPKGNRVYFSNGDADDGVLEIVDREKLLNGPKEPTDENLRYPVVGRIDLPPDMGVNASFPLIQMHLPEFAKQKEGSLKDFVAVIGGGHADFYNCVDARQMMRIFDITTESKPVGVSTWTVPEASGNFCSRGGYFSTHASNENFTPIYHNRVLFIAHHIAGVRAVDIRDPYHPKEIGYYIPAVTAMTDKSCFDIEHTLETAPGADRDCKTVIDTNNVEVDDRGYIYIVDQHDTGMHILQLTGTARQVADFSKAEDSAARQ